MATHPEEPFFAGQVFGGQWQAKQLLGSGNFSLVFEGLELRNGQAVAIKVLSLGASLDKQALDDFDGEIALFRKLGPCSRILDLEGEGAHSISIAPVGGHSPGSAATLNARFAILELGEGSLAELVIEVRDRLLWADRLRLVRDTALGVAQMHRLNTVHRDVKAENVILVGINAPVAKLGDLGRAKDLDLTPRLPPLLYAFPMGDLRFSAPELIWGLGDGDATAHTRSDLYQVGALFFEIATGIGLTTFMLPDPMTTIRAIQSLSAQDRLREYQMHIPALRDAYALAYKMFSESVPPCIRGASLNLLRRLTDPDPMRRAPAPLPGSKTWDRRDLQWLLRRFDTLMRILRESDRRARRRPSKAVA